MPGDEVQTGQELVTGRWQEEGAERFQAPSAKSTHCPKRKHKFENTVGISRWQPQSVEVPRMVSFSAWDLEQLHKLHAHEAAPEWRERVGGFLMPLVSSKGFSSSVS